MYSFNSLQYSVFLPTNTNEVSELILLSVSKMSFVFFLRSMLPTLNK